MSCVMTCETSVSDLYVLILVSLAPSQLITEMLPITQYDSTMGQPLATPPEDSSGTAEWRSTSTIPGAPFVTTAGASRMQIWPAGN